MLFGANLLIGNAGVLGERSCFAPACVAQDSAVFADIMSTLFGRQMQISKNITRRLSRPLIHGFLAGVVILVIASCGLFYLWSSAREAQLDERELWKKVEADAMTRMKAAGIEIIPIADKKPFQDAVKPVWDKYGAKYADLIKQIQAVN